MRIGAELPPVAVGAVGGSGTRVIAGLLRRAGVEMGGDLNAANDNLWFTLLFKRLEVLVAPGDELARLFTLFRARMRGEADLLRQDEACRTLADLAAVARPQHPQLWLARRAESFTGAPVSSAPAAGWGWKEPNTHVVVERLLELDPSLRYVHVMRSGLDMAFSVNRNQLGLWGEVFLGREVAAGPRDALAYWCAVHRRMARIAARFPERVLLFDFDAMCDVPAPEAARLLAFCGHELGGEDLADFAAGVRVPASRGGFRGHGTGDFAPEDLAYVAQLGYPVD